MIYILITLFVGDLALEEVLLLVTEGPESSIQIAQLNLSLIQFLLYQID